MSIVVAIHPMFINIYGKNMVISNIGKLNFNFKINEQSLMYGTIQINHPLGIPSGHGLKIIHFSNNGRVESNS